MSTTKKIYSREEKIVYFALQVAKLEEKLAKMRARLSFTMSDKYQEWESSVAAEIAAKKGGEGQ